MWMKVWEINRQRNRLVESVAHYCLYCQGMTGWSAGVMYIPRMYKSETKYWKTLKEGFDGLLLMQVIWYYYLTPTHPPPQLLFLHSLQRQVTVLLTAATCWLRAAPAPYVVITWHGRTCTAVAECRPLHHSRLTRSLVSHQQLELHHWRCSCALYSTNSTAHVVTWSHET